MSVKFEDNRIEVEKALGQKAIAFLYEAKDALVSQTQRNTPVVSGDLKRSFGEDSYVDEDKLVAYIGTSKEYGIWVEMGTGEYAVNGDGRKGGWYIPADKLDNRTRGLFDYKYRFPIKYGKGGTAYYYTTGMKPKRPLYKAYIIKGKKVQQQANKIYRELNNL